MKNKNTKVIINSSASIEKEDKCYNNTNSLVKAVQNKINNNKLTLMPAYRGWIDNEELGFPDIFVRSVLFDCLMAAGFCPDCSNEYIEWFENEINEKGQKKHIMMIDRNEADIWLIADMENEEQIKKQQQNKKSKKSK